MMKQRKKMWNRHLPRRSRYRVLTSADERTIVVRKDTNVIRTNRIVTGNPCVSVVGFSRSCRTNNLRVGVVLRKDLHLPSMTRSPFGEKGRPYLRNRILRRSTQSMSLCAGGLEIHTFEGQLWFSSKRIL